ncbi:hypothetical protein [Thermoflavimicrobium dichotomicum]|uniref:Uncharacterized protein n=1 Tax=Thermoflavimicrobium dichotomicum TaxID=46223 RepID=A0A1I3RA65_9BACL|nr:hypothetical protein [Thermoflavimicrobium dichotomicum]SFJ43208.1 hypothetical protein SAMN05421852_109100 [Thermoflavimicrobium dichotomicum]
MSDNDKLDLILQKLNTMQSDIDHLKANMVTREEVQAAKESAASVDDKAEAGYVVLKSLLDGMENRLRNEFNNVYERIELMDDKIGHGFEQIGGD